MKTLFIIPLVLMSLVSFPSWGLTMDDLVKREGIYYKKFSDVPFTGEIDEGLIRPNFKNGKEEGTWVSYHKNRQLSDKGNFNKGRKEGTWIYYYDDGQLYDKGNYNNGGQEGTWVSYHRNGQLRSKGHYKNWEREGPWVFFKKDGTKRMSENFSLGFKIDEGSGVYRNGVKVSD